MRRIQLLLILTCFTHLFSFSQGTQRKVIPPRWAVKTDVLYWVTTTLNLGFEYAFTDKITVDIKGSYNPFHYKSKAENKKLKHWLVQPELRLWQCEKYIGGFWGFHLQYGRYNAGGVKLPLGIWRGLADYRYEGYMTGAGVSYGYAWFLAPRWNLEAEFGFGYNYLRYRQYECRKCGAYIGKDTHHYFGPTRLSLSLVYLF